MSRGIRINWAACDHLLGTDYDEQVGLQIGCCRAAVLKRRKRLGIPPYMERSCVPARPRNILDLLAKTGAEDLAREWRSLGGLSFRSEGLDPAWLEEAA